MKKFLTLVCTFLMAASFTGCGSENPAQTSEIQTIKIGMIKNLNTSEDKYNAFMKKFEENANIKLAHHQVIFYSSLPLMKASLENGDLQEISVYKFVKDYIMDTDPRYEMAKNHVGNKKVVDNFAFALRAEDTALKDSVNVALADMQSLGVLKNMINVYITNFEQAEIPAVEFEKFDGAETLKVGITGDLPPMDLILEDGTPKGFNAALISELGKRLQKNIQIVKIDSASRAAALASKEIDIAFWAIIPTNDAMPLDLEKPQGIELSEPYFQDEIFHINLKN